MMAACRGTPSESAIDPLDVGPLRHRCQHRRKGSLRWVVLLQAMVESCRAGFQCVVQQPPVSPLPRLRPREGLDS
jgi:hypothetical protein